MTKAVACTPDWQPVADLWTNSLLALGDVITNWMNVAAMLIQQKITGATIKCDKEVRLYIDGSLHRPRSALSLSLGKIA